MDPLCKIAQNHGIAILEDAALAPGAEYRDRRVGSLGHAAVVSFGPTKVLAGLGWGGILVTDDPEIDIRARQLAAFGPILEHADSNIDLEGYNAQLSSLLAACVRVKLRYLDKWLERRRTIAASYDEACDRLGIRRLHPQPWVKPSYRVYVIRHPQRNFAIMRLRELGIDASAHFVPAMHLREIYARLGYQRGDFPIAEKTTEELICLPVHPHLTDENVKYIIKSLEKIV